MHTAQGPASTQSPRGDAVWDGRRSRCVAPPPVRHYEPLTDLIVRLLTGESYEVDVASDAQQAQHFGLARTYDVVVMDRDLMTEDNEKSAQRIVTGTRQRRRPRAISGGAAIAGSWAVDAVAQVRDVLREIRYLWSGQPADQFELDVVGRQVVEQPSALPE